MVRDPEGLACVNCGYVRYPEPPAEYTRETRHMGHKGKQARTLVMEGSRA